MNNPEELTNSELLERIEYLSRTSHLGTWGERELSKTQAEATKRKLKTKEKSK